jgi:hypothetical protein
VRIATKKLVTALAMGLLATSAADARVAEKTRAVMMDDAPQSVAQRGCMSLSQAVDSVRRRGNVERVISAEKRGDTHYIKVLTKDGKVRTHQVPAC